MWVFKVRKNRRTWRKKSQKIWRQRLILGHIGERRLLSPLPQACPPTTPPPLRQRKLYFINRGQFVKKITAATLVQFQKVLYFLLPKKKRVKPTFDVIGMSERSDVDVNLVCVRLGRETACVG